MSRGISITIPGQPIPKARPRFNRRTGRTYTPERTKTAEQRVAWEVKRQLLIDEPLACLLQVDALFVVKGNRKVDGDNCLKLIQDALNNVLYLDDSQIVAGSYRVERGDDPRTELTITELA